MGYRMLQAMETGKSGAFAEFLSGGRHHHVGTAGGGRTAADEDEQDDRGEKQKMQSALDTKCKACYTLFAKLAMQKEEKRGISYEKPDQGASQGEQAVPE